MLTARERLCKDSLQRTNQLGISFALIKDNFQFLAGVTNSTHRDPHLRKSAKKKKKSAAKWGEIQCFHDVVDFKKSTHNLKVESYVLFGGNF